MMALGTVTFLVLAAWKVDRDGVGFLLSLTDFAEVLSGRAIKELADFHCILREQLLFVGY